MTYIYQTYRSYSTAEKAAVNLGAYSVDVGYLISYNQSKEVLKYIEGMKILAERFDFESAFNNSDLIYGVNENIDKKELLKDIYSGKLQETNEILNSQFDSKVIIYFTYGQLIESLYIVTSIANEYPARFTTRTSPNSLKTIYQHIS